MGDCALNVFISLIIYKEVRYVGIYHVDLKDGSSLDTQNIGTTAKLPCCKKLQIYQIMITVPAFPDRLINAECQ